MILHIPHSSTHIPAEIRPQFISSEQELDHEILRMTDHYTDELFDWPNAEKVIAKVSRLVVDPERFVNDQLEHMSKKGMGVIYENNSYGKRMKLRPSRKMREEILQKYYFSHHDKLTELVKQELLEKGRSVVIDCHSFSDTPRSYEINQDKNRADICLGTCDFHTPPELMTLVRDFFETRGYSVAINAPFAGCLIPMDYYQEDARVHGIMIELNRRLYLNEETAEKTNGFGKLQADLLELADLLKANYR